ncbi:MAG: hypothetical protein U0103_16880 [Candidatus Obscuribacterales bacterium]
MDLCLTALPSMEGFFRTTVYDLPWKVDGVDSGLNFFYARVKLSSLLSIVEVAEVRFCNGNSQHMTLAGAHVLGVKNGATLAAQERSRWKSIHPAFGSFGLGDIIVQLPMDYVPCLRSRHYPDRQSQAYVDLCREYLEQNEVVVLFVERVNEVPSEIAQLTPTVTWNCRNVAESSYFNRRDRVLDLMKEMSIL